MTDTLSAPVSAPTSSQPAEPSVTNFPRERRVVTSIPGPKSRAMHERRLAVVASGVSSGFPIYVERAHGAVIVDIDGNQFLDLGSGIGVTTIGHTDDGVVEAARHQLGELTHGLFTVTPYEGYVRVAELLAEHTPGNFAKKSVLVNSGAEAVENGVKIARKYTGRRGVAVLDHAFHGRTNLTMAMNYKSMPYGLGFGPFVGDIHHAPNSYPYLDGRNGAEAAEHTISYLEKTAGASDLACLVVEPIQGEGGFMVPAEGYLPALQKWCTDNGIVFIADEIQCGMGRTGTYYASEHFGLVPDLVLSAKGIAGGLPLATVTGRAEIMDAAHAGGLGGTFGGNPVATAAAIAVFDAIEKKGLLAEATRIETTLKRELERVQKSHDTIGEIRGKGAMIAVEFVQPGTGSTTKKPNAAIVSAISKYAFEHGLILLTAGTNGNVIRFLPSLVITDDQLLDAVSVIEDALASL